MFILSCCDIVASRVLMRPFYERSLEERRALTAVAVAKKTTVIERWVALGAAEASPWSQRAAIAAELLKDAASIADFGCGTMILERHLGPDQKYIGLDVVARDSRTIVCDLNLTSPPETGAIAAAFLGVFEYLHDPAAVLRHLHRQYAMIVTSYCVTDAPDAMADRREHAWVNDFSSAEIVVLFRSTGWVPDQEVAVDRLQKLWRLRSVEAPSEAAATQDKLILASNE